MDGNNGQGDNATPAAPKSQFKRVEKVSLLEANRLRNLGTTRCVIWRDFNDTDAVLRDKRSSFIIFLFSLAFAAIMRRNIELSTDEVSS